MAKPTTVKIRLNSTADTGHFYVTKKNARTMTEKMVVRKYDPIVRKHVEYKEGREQASIRLPRGKANSHYAGSSGSKFQDGLRSANSC